jgi:glycosyltransferase involved in cell wall biosynthesis
MRILMISATFPFPPTLGGTQVRTFYLLKHLSQHHDITLVTQRSRDVPGWRYCRPQSLGGSIDSIPTTQPHQSATRHSWKIALRFAHFLKTGTPPSTTFLAVPTMAHWIDEWVTTGNCDIVTCEHSVNEVFVKPHFRQHTQKVVVDIHSSLHGTVKNQLATGTAEKALRDRLNLWLMHRYERQYVQKFTDLVLTTAEDRQFFEPLAGSTPLHVVPNGVELAKFPYRQTDPRRLFPGLCGSNGLYRQRRHS